MFSFKIASVLLVIQLSLGEGHGDYEYDDLNERENEHADYYVDYDESVENPIQTSNQAYNDTDSTLSVTRIRRHQKQANIKTLSPDDIREVRGALKQLLPDIAAENPFTPHATSSFTEYRPTVSTSLDISSTTPMYTILETASVNPGDESSNTAPSTTSAENISLDIISQMNSLGKPYKKYKPVSVSYRNQWKVSPTRSPDPLHMLRNGTDTLNSIVLTETAESEKNFTNSSITTTQEARSRELDIPQLLAIISDLAYDFETNLTRKLNETLSNMSIPTCITPTVTTEMPQTDAYDANYTGSVVAKCFVCGLDTPGIPQHAHCADAFAGDFLPLVPVDPSAKGKISRFRKYCKYSNIQGYRVNDTQPRAIHGRWTGGCAVRWIDLSGVYTQRTCRNRMQPALGQHFASKRMAKLEKTLWNVDNGCIVSPMATLVPLSRGVSLYARFHACVCAGNWCNASGDVAPRTLFDAIVLIFAFGVT